MAYTLTPFNPSTPYQNQVATELNTANNNFKILGQAFYNNDPTSQPILRASYIGSSAPSNPVAGMTWLDTSTTPPVLKVYGGSAWQSNVINTTDADKVDGFHASQIPVPNTIPVSNTSGKLDDDWLNFITNDPKVKTALNASGDAPIYACRAWVNFDGTTNPPTIRASGNVSSITKNGTGDYTINFSTALPDNNYSVCIGSVMYSTSNNTVFTVLKGSSKGSNPCTKTTSALGVVSADASSTADI
jgi:hypothetical protein